MNQDTPKRTLSAACKKAIGERNQTLNCRKCGGEIFIASVDRGTNGINAILHHIGCNRCKDRWLLAPTVIEAIQKWVDWQVNENLPEVFSTPCGGNTPRFPIE